MSCSNTVLVTTKRTTYHNTVTMLTYIFSQLRICSWVFSIVYRVVGL